MKLLSTADWHLRADRPRCRIDEDWLATQDTILTFIAEESQRRKCPVIIGGDLYDTPTVPDRIKLMFQRFLAAVTQVAFMPGNHDLPYHSTQNLDSSSIGLLWHTAYALNLDKLTPIEHFGRWRPFDSDSIVGSYSPDRDIVLFLHTLCFPTAKDMPPNVDAATAAELLADYPDAKWIFTGDMHKAFHYEKKGRHVINPGCISRQVADMKDYRPLVYFVDTDAGVVEEVYLPDTGPVVIDSYLREEEAREDRISAFVEQVRNSGEFSLSFIDNINGAIKAHPELDEDTVHTIRELMEAN